MVWPKSFARIPNEPWTEQPLGELALKYDTVENHGWYTNLTKTVEQLDAFLEDGQVLLDYSGGTGILADRLLARWGRKPRGILIVDSSPKFLRLAVEKFRTESRLAFRRIHYLKSEKRLQTLQECVNAELLTQGVDAIVSTNAIHLYYNLEDTLAGWRDAMRPGGGVFVQSGNIDNPQCANDEWIIDNTVHALHERAIDLVRGGAYPAYRHHLDDAPRMARYDRLREKYFLPVRPRAYYENALTKAGFSQLEMDRARIEASVDEWYDFLAAYHEGVLGWVGGVEKIEGQATTSEDIENRLGLMREAMQGIFEGRSHFACCWTYLNAKRPR